MQKLLASALSAGILAAMTSAPAFAQMRTSAPAGGRAPTATVTGDASVASRAGTTLTDSGIIFAPRYMPANNTELGVAVGAITGSINSPFGLAGIDAHLADGMDWGVLLSGESQAGLRQRYASSGTWSWGGSYLARLNLTPAGANTGVGVDDYGLTYRNELMYSAGGFDLYAQPEVSYYFTKYGPQAALAVGADYTPVSAFSIGVAGQGIAYRGGTQPYGAFEKRASVGAKFYPNDDLYLFLNGTFLLDRSSQAYLVGLGYRLH